MTGTVPAAAALELRRDDRLGRLGPGALAMIGETEAELAALYPPEVRHALSPAQRLDAGMVFLTAHLDGQLVGCGGMAPGDRHGELKRLLVARAARGRRIAAAIIGRLEDEARIRDLRLMRLETGAASPEVIRAYERLGYRRCGPFGRHAENGSSVLVEKAL